MITGAILTAPNEDFENVFSIKPTQDGNVEYTAKGRISDQRLAKR
jgi:hypothetical protein